MKFTFLSVLLVCAIQILAKAPVLSKDDLSVPPPRIIRTCCSFGADLTIAKLPFTKQSDITSLAGIGVHKYLGHKDEGNGNIYTRRGGFIDLGHLRDCADWTAYLYNRMVAQKAGNPIIIDLGSEGGHKTLTISIPEGAAAPDLYSLAGKIAYDLSVWHEIATWFGASYIPMVPERYSSFSPEDLYSNLLGVTLGIRALKSELSYDQAMTLLIAETLDSLQAVETIEETYAAMDKVENIWWTSEKSLPSKKVLLKRYYDSGEHLTPWLIPDVNFEQKPYTLQKPEAALSSFYEFKIKLNYRFPVKDIFVSQIDRTITQEDFDRIISYIEQDDLLPAKS